MPKSETVIYNLVDPETKISSSIEIPFLVITPVFKYSNSTEFYNRACLPPAQSSRLAARTLFTPSITFNPVKTGLHYQEVLKEFSTEVLGKNFRMVMPEAPVPLYPTTEQGGFFQVDPATVVMKISGFTSASEFPGWVSKLRDLQRKNYTNLIIDLAGNGGGELNF